LVVTWLAILFLAGEIVHLPLIIAIIPVAIGLYFLTPAYCKWSIKRGVSRQLKSGGINHIIGNIRLEFTEDSILYTNTDVDQSLKFDYASISSVVEGDQGLLLSFDKGQAMIVPELAFENPDVKNQVNSYIDSKVAATD
jgi:hypothetical protein